MEARYVIIARHAEFLPDGSVNILGGDSQKILADSFPALHPSLNVAVRIAMNRDEAAAEHTLKAFILGPDGEVVQEGISGTIPSFDLPQETKRMSVGLVMPFWNIIFPKADWYKVSIHLDNKEIGEAPLRLQDRGKHEEYQKSLLEKLRGSQTHESPGRVQPGSDAQPDAESSY